MESTKNNILGAHRLPRKWDNKSLMIARFMDRNLINEIYRNRTVARHFTKNQFPVAGISRFFVYKNLTQFKTRVQCQIKPEAKQLKYVYMWTTV